MADGRRLEKVANNPGIYRRHAGACKRAGRCKCPYIVRWKDRGQEHKQMFGTLDLAREFKGGLHSGKSTRRPLSSETVAGYWGPWFARYRGRTSRGLEETTRREYEISFRLHVSPLAIARVKMRDLAAPDVRDWLADLERRGCSPTTIRKAKAALQIMLACAAQDGHIASNPATSVRYVPSDQAKRAHPRRKRRGLSAADVAKILEAMTERWRAFHMLLVQSGVRVGELLGLTWRNVHLGDDPHIMVVEQVYYGKRKRLKTDASAARVPLSQSMASWLADLRPSDVDLDAPVFPSVTGTPLNYHNVYSRVLRPALIKSGIATNRGTDDEPDWDYQGVAFHAFRKACGSLLLAQGKNIKQVQGWLRHAQLTTTLNVYIHHVDSGLGSAEAWDEILPPSGSLRGHSGATERPETSANAPIASVAETQVLQTKRGQPQTSVSAQSES